MICITREVLSPDLVVAEAKTLNSGCVCTYVGLIRDNSYGKMVASVEYSDPDGTAEQGLKAIVEEIKNTCDINEMAFHHRIGKLVPGDVNIVIAIAAGHRGEAFEACQKAVDLFKEKLPSSKVETYTDGTTKVSD